MENRSSKFSLAVGFFLCITYPAFSAELQVRAVWARPTLGNQTVGAAYMTITNESNISRTLVAASAPVAGRIELHTHEHGEDGMMRMRQLEQLEIPAGKRVRFAPGGHHLMLFDLTAPLKTGEHFSVTLTWGDGSNSEHQAQVRSIDGTPASAH